MTDTVEEINDYLKSESYEMRRLRRPPAKRRAMDSFGGQIDPGPCPIACGACLLCRCHERFEFQAKQVAQFQR